MIVKREYSDKDHLQDAELARLMTLSDDELDKLGYARPDIDQLKENLEYMARRIARIEAIRDRLIEANKQFAKDDK